MKALNPSEPSASHNQQWGLTRAQISQPFSHTPRWCFTACGFHPKFLQHQGNGSHWAQFCRCSRKMGRNWIIEAEKRCLFWVGLDVGTQERHGKQGFVDLCCSWGKKKPGEGCPNLLLQGLKLFHSAWKRSKKLLFFIFHFELSLGMDNIKVALIGESNNFDFRKSTKQPPPPPKYFCRSGI